MTAPLQPFNTLGSASHLKIQPLCSKFEGAVQETSPATGAPHEESDSGLQPVDVDLNLVQNLLASYGAQEGLPGPAGNLAAALGLQMHLEEQGPSSRQEHRKQ